MCAYIYIYTHVYICIYIYITIDMWVHMSVRIQAGIHTHLSPFMYVHARKARALGGLGRFKTRNPQVYLGNLIPETVNPSYGVLLAGYIRGGLRLGKDVNSKPKGCILHNNTSISTIFLLGRIRGIS